MNGSYPSLVWETRQEIARYLRRVARDKEWMVDDACSVAMEDALTKQNEIEQEQAGSEYTLETRLLLFMRTAALRALGRERRASGRAYSLDAPMSEEDGDMEWSERVVYRRSTPAAIEDHIDANKIARYATHMCTRDQRILRCMADGLTAEEIALEIGVTPSEARASRAAIIRKILAHVERGADIGRRSSAG